MAWLESHQTLGQHPKTRKLAHLLGVSKPAAVGHLQYLWWWAMDYAEDGDLSKFDDLDIAIGAEWEGDHAAFIDALTSSGFLDQHGDGTYRIHDWQDYGGKLAERRKANAERMRRARAERDTGTDDDRAAHVQRTQRARAGLEESTGEERREEEKKEGANAPLDPDDSPKKPKRASRIPSDFAVTDQMREWASSKGVDDAAVEQETEQFINYWLAESGAKASKIDWAAAWKVWMGRRVNRPSWQIHHGGRDQERQRKVF